MTPGLRARGRASSRTGGNAVGSGRVRRDCSPAVDASLRGSTNWDGGVCNWGRRWGSRDGPGVDRGDSRMAGVSYGDSLAAVSLSSSHRAVSGVDSGLLSDVNLASGRVSRGRGSLSGRNRADRGAGGCWAGRVAAGDEVAETMVPEV